MNVFSKIQMPELRTDSSFEILIIDQNVSEDLLHRNKENLSRFNGEIWFEPVGCEKSVRYWAIPENRCDMITPNFDELNSIIDQKLNEGSTAS